MAGFFSKPIVLRNVFSKFSLVLNGFEEDVFLHCEVWHFLHSVDYHIPGIQETFQASALKLNPFEIGCRVRPEPFLSKSIVRQFAI